MKQLKGRAIIILLLIVLIVPSVALASWWNPFSWNIWQNIWNSIFYKQASVECSVAKDCQDIYKNCYYSCSSNKCVQVNTLVALKPYPDCSSAASCIPNWQCGWGPCINGYQQPTSTDTNNCGLPSGNDSCNTLPRVCTSQPSINILSPNGGENWKIGSIQTISWNSDNAPSGSWVALFLTNGPFVVQGLPVRGSYPWKIPTEYCGGDVCGFKLSPGSNYKIEARLYKGSALCLGLCSPIIVQPTLLAKDYSDAPLDIQAPAATSFCGVSTYGKCSSNSDCITGGCSGEVCQSKNENEVVSACIYKDCYNAKTYGVSCGCAQSECQWIK